MKNEIMLTNLMFEGKSLRIVDVDGRKMVFARDLGRSLEYAADGKRLVDNITEKWSGEFNVGEHYEIRDMDEVGTGSVPTSGVSKFMPRAMLLTEEGVHLVLLNTRKPIGTRLRQFLAAEIMPRLMRGETIQGRNPTPPRGEQTAPVLNSAQQALLREARMLARFAAKAGVANEAVVAWQAGVFQGVTGIVTTHLLPHVKPENEGMLASEVAAELVREVGPRATEAKVGKVITQLGLRGDPKYSVQVFGKARGHDKTVTPWKYNTAAVALIKPAVRAWVEREEMEAREKDQRRAAKAKKKPSDDDVLI